MAITLACANLVLSCPKVITVETEDEVLAEAGWHAAVDHGLTVAAKLGDPVRANTRDDSNSSS